jgi:hypothetical protein
VSLPADFALPNDTAPILGAGYLYFDELLDAATGEDVRIDVIVPNEIDAIDLESRELATRTVTVEVVLRRQFGVDDQASATGAIDKPKIDALVELAESLGLSATFERLAGFDAAAWVGSAHDPLFDRARLRQQRQFFSVTLLTFEISSAL